MRSYDAAAVEGQWRAAWQRAGCFRAPDRPTGDKFFNYDSGPFPNGPLHLGHVRTYALGDLTARYQRLLGKTVLYCTEFDAFGLPNELAALEAGVSPREYTNRCIRLMRRQMQRLGISYDWSRVPCTADPRYYRWTQWLFLELLRLGLVERRAADLNWCPGCRTTLARMQVDHGACWRCAAEVETKSLPQWFVNISRYSRRLREGLDELDHWSRRSKALLRGFIGDGQGPETGGGYCVHDWLVSRQRSWGTPIPIVHCTRCGHVPVPLERLPVRLPDELDWSLGSQALAACESFVATACPQCGRSARRETDTLDCFFDDIWCFLACLTSLDDRFSFSSADLAAWMPIDRFHSGFDTFFYLHLHRFLGRVLHEQGRSADPEPIRGYLGHDMVLAAGRKMSKHLGNAVSPETLIDQHGADALRVAVLWAAGPQRTIDWNEGLLQRAVALLDAVYVLYARCAGVAGAGTSGATSGATSKAARTLCSETSIGIARVARFIEQYRPNAAIEVLASLLHRIEDYALHRIRTARLRPADAPLLAQVLRDYAVAFSPFAPHLAEALWQLLGRPPFVCQASWPREARPPAAATSDRQSANL